MLMSQKYKKFVVINTFEFNFFYFWLIESIKFKVLLLDCLTRVLMTQVSMIVLKKKIQWNTQKKDCL